MRFVLFLSLIGCIKSPEKSEDAVGGDLDVEIIDTDTDTDPVDSDTDETATPACEGTLVFSAEAETPTHVDPDMPKVFIVNGLAVGGDVLIDQVEMAVTGPAEWLATLPSLDAGVQYCAPDGFCTTHCFGPSCATDAVYDEANGRVVWTVPELLRLVSRDPVEVEPLTVFEGETFVFTLSIYRASSVTGVTPEVLDGNCQEGVLGEPVSW